MKNFKALFFGSILIFSLSGFSNPLVFSTIQRSTATKVDMSEKVLRKAYEKLGITIRVLPLPGKRSLSTSNSGKVDGELRRKIGVSHNFPNLIRISIPVEFLDVCFLKFNGHKTIKQQDLSQYTVGIIRGGRTSKKIASSAKSSIEITKVKQLFDMIKYKRIDIAVANCRVLNEAILKTQFNEFTVQSPPIVRTPLFHYLHKKHSALVPKITKVLAKMQDTGEIKNIISNFNE